MKIKTISRSFESATRDSKLEVRKVHKNADPRLHPFENAREVTRAVTAAKMERMFAQPFISAMNDHSDGVYCMSMDPASMNGFVTGAGNGEVIVWDLPSQKSLWKVKAHSGLVKGVAVAYDGESFFSCGDDRTIKQWKLTSAAPVADSAAAGAGAKRSRAAITDEEETTAPIEDKRKWASMKGRSGRGFVRRRVDGSDDEGEEKGEVIPSKIDITPMNVWSGKHAYLYIDHHWKHKMFATSSVGIQVWDYNRSEPIHSYEWGADSVTTVRFNPAEPSLLGSTGADRSVCLYDVRTDSALRKTVLHMSANALAWNPREPFNFTVASEDSNCYTFDMRRMDHALMVHKDHVHAVMDVAYSPTGKEFVTASYDRTIRIWRADQGKSREIYHTKRMQRVFTAKYSPDAKYILSGSDDCNVRLWKANASAPLGRMMPRERNKMDYMDSLKKRYAHVPEVRKILTQRHVPKSILKGKEAKFVQDQKSRRKLANIRAHTKPGSKEGMPEPERSKHIVGEFK